MDISIKMTFFGAGFPIPILQCYTHSGSRYTVCLYAAICARDWYMMLSNLQEANRSIQNIFREAKQSR